MVVIFLISGNSMQDIENLKNFKLYFLLLECIPKEMGDAQFFEINKILHLNHPHSVSGIGNWGYLKVIK